MLHIKTTLKRFILLALSGVVLLAGCETSQPAEKPSDASGTAAKEVNFTVGLNDVGAYGAEVLVRHDGKPVNMWYGFNTTDLTTDVNTLIGAQLPSVTDKTIVVGTTKVVKVDGLDEKTSYRYIAFGVTPEGEVYGNPGSIVYSTDLDYQVGFEAEISDITIDGAKVSITHNGNEALTYAGFITTDVTTSVKSLVAADYASRLDGGKVAEPEKLMSGQTGTVTLSGLDSDTPYRYIVYGLQDGEAALLYGTPAGAAFATLIDYDNVVFSGEATATTKTTATLNVTYTGANNGELGWYGFNTTDLSSKAADLIAAEIAAGIDEKAVRSGKDQTVKLEDLTLLTDYRYIVTGIKDGAAYGIPADISYQTADEDYDDITFTVKLVGEPGLDNATVKVTHDGGKDKFQWIGILTTNLTAEAASLLPKPEEVKKEDVKSGQELDVEITGLNLKTEYRYIVAGYRVDASGTAYLYGTPGEVSFKTDNFYKEAASWKLSFDGKTTDYEGYPFKFTNTVKKNGTDGKYFITAVEASKASGYADMDSFLTAIVPDEIKAQEDLEDITDQTSSAWFNLAYKSYIVLAIGVDDEGEPTGKYASLNYTNEPSDAEKAAYNKWLGRWKIVRGKDDTAVEDMLTISEKEMMDSYNILGFENGMFDDIGALEAKFDPGTGNMQIYAQILGQTEISGRGTTEIGLYGYVESTGYFYTFSGNPYKIAEISINADGKTAAVAPGSVSAGTLDAMRYYGKVISTGGFIGWNTGYTYLPNTLTRPSDTGSAAYNAWLGSWSVPRNGAADTWTIKQDVADYSFTIEGVESLPNRVVKATFDTGTGEIIVNVQKDLYKYTDSDGNSVSDHLYGRVPVDGTVYYITGTYEIFRGKVSGNSATLTGGKVTLNVTGESQDFDVTGMTVYAWDAEKDEVLGTYLEEGEEYTQFPATLTKTGSSSVRSIAPAKVRTRARKGAAAASCEIALGQTEVISNAKRIRK